jgi:hypothetical protein
VRRARAVHVPAALKIDHLHFDTAALTETRAGRRIDLTRTATKCWPG